MYIHYELQTFSCSISCIFACINLPSAKYALLPHKVCVTIAWLYAFPVQDGLWHQKIALQEGAFDSNPLFLPTISGSSPRY